MDINKSLYALSNEYALLYDNLLNTVDEDGVIDETIFESVMQAKGDLQTKLSNTTNVYRAMSAEIEKFNTEIARITAIRDKIVKAQEKLFAYIDAACRTANIVEVQGDFVSIKYKKNPPSVKILDESLVPEEYKETVVETTVKIDKKKIKADIQAGKEIAGAYLQQDIRLEIK